VGGTDHRNAHSSIDEATNNQVRSFPFVCKSQREPFEELCCLTAYKAIRGGVLQRRDGAKVHVSKLSDFPLKKLRDSISFLIAKILMGVL
jgi:hypothetical protein